MALYDILQAKGISATQLAEMTKFRRTTIHDWLTNPDRVPNGKKMLKLCEVLNVTANDILGIPDNKSTNTDKALMNELLMAVTNDGETKSEELHEIANRFALMHHVKLGTFFRRTAFVVAKIEQRGTVFKWQTLRKEQEEQLRLF
jgi:DNA-binding Xre family transcriptional regulator